MIFSSQLLELSGFQSGDELEAEAKKGEIRLKRREKGR